MKDFINALYRNHSLIYKVLLYIATTFFIVYLFPTSGKFKYSFEKGKPWQSETLQAPFDFAIKKTNEELEEERNTIKKNASVYFDLNATTDSIVLSNYDNQFNISFNDSLKTVNKVIFYTIGKQMLSEALDKGILDNDYNYPSDKSVIVLNERVQVKSTVYSEFLKQEAIKTYFEEKIALQN